MLLRVLLPMQWLQERNPFPQTCSERDLQENQVLRQQGNLWVRVHQTRTLVRVFRPMWPLGERSPFHRISLERNLRKRLALRRQSRAEYRRLRVNLDRKKASQSEVRYHQSLQVTYRLGRMSPMFLQLLTTRECRLRKRSQQRQPRRPRSPGQ